MTGHPARPASGGQGLDAEGRIVREGALDRVTPAFRPVVDAVRTRIVEAFGEGAPSERPDAEGDFGTPGGSRLHSAYLYGSIPRGTATVGVSDLDVLVVLDREPTERDREDAARVGARLDAEFGQFDGAGILLQSADSVLSDLERHDLGFFVACLCTPLYGPDLGRQLPDYRPTSLLARETNGDLALFLERWSRRLSALEPGGAADAAPRAAPEGVEPDGAAPDGVSPDEVSLDAEVRGLARGIGRHLTRTGFTLVMPRWGGWTSDLAASAEVFGAYYPEWAEQMCLAASVGIAPTGDTTVPRTLLDGLTPWLITEYARVHGVKAPRP